MKIEPAQAIDSSELTIPVNDSLQGRTILVTGAGDGIGKAAARTFARSGATVILLGRTQSKLEAVYDAIASENLPEAIIHPMDLAIAGSEDYDTLGRSIQEQFPALDGLLHNASELGALGPIQHYAPESWMKLMQININAVFMLTRALLPALQQSDDARILFTSSSVGRKGRAYWGAYAVSKFATEGLMQVLAEELAETTRIRVNSINPGATRTEMRRAAYPAENPMSLPTAESLMPAYLHLMQPGSASHHGETIDIRTLLTELPG
ncbi:YciK family oxidoreductase [Pseudohongiella sp.]|uniref:YciK family oxidoreductase n=1 Tax=marine sediment metagenome TaxID=412755 RepID=A0A0F9Z0P5_9ZZZZ|nr:YciK family oxidoreductase [Pseudohongiella sp.]HDZ09902.1 YciK family oxidoreductase [Pseudohongiella sp.]HEA63648.1 YciK family oxidoreductase [Pseudohongiella sp.]